MPRKLEPSEFWTRVEMSPGCWVWMGPTRPDDGRGLFPLEGKRHTAVHVAWILTHGTIPRGRQIRHTCENIHCVNPDHMYTVGFTEDQQEIIRQEYWSGRNQTEIANQYGTRRETINRIVNRKYHTTQEKRWVK